MDDGLGLLVTTRPHGKTAAQLLQRIHDIYDRRSLYELAASNGHVSILQWLLDNTPDINDYQWQEISERIADAAVQRGRVVVLKWLGTCQSRHVSLTLM